MKRLAIIVTALTLVLGLAQCKKENPNGQNGNEGNRVHITVKVGGSGSKADINPATGDVTFRSGDKLYVGYNNACVGALNFDGSGFSGDITLTQSGNQRLYFYYLGGMEATIEGGIYTVSISNQTTAYPVISYGQSSVDYSDAVKAYSTTLLNQCALVKFNVTTSSTAATCITGFKNKVAVDFSGNTITPSKEGDGVIKLPAGNGEKWAILLPQNALAAGGTGTAYSDDMSYNGTRGAVPAISANDYLSSGISITISTSNYVDLGLPSGTLWAICNVGAHAPEGYGDYFAWGETQPKDIYGWSTYKYCKGSNNALTKYCNNSSYGYNGFTDNLTTLLVGDDAATVNWGSGWRMPTQDEWRELYNNTTKTWTSQNGVYGFIFAGGNGNRIFLPAAGDSDIGPGSTGCYWSSSLETDAADCAWYFYFYNPNSNWASSASRDFGYSVRAVRPGQNVQSYTISVSASPSSGGTVSGGGTYYNGQSCTVTAATNSGYSFTNWTINGSVVSSNPSYTFTVNGNKALVANFNYNGGGNVPTGAINGLFSINNIGGQVYFSQGNLQYRASTKTWRFAEHQYDYVGSANSNISSTYSGWIDLFGWGTSGYNHGANCYQPWSTTATYSDYYAYGNYYWDLNSSTGQADWGYNPISNGGNQTNQWRTLTYAEWNYVFNVRSTTSGIRYAKAKVNNVNGVILLPDDWNSSYFYLGNTNNSGATFSSNTINASQWNTLEQHGAVFLPAAGYRLGASSISSVSSSGCYWSSSYYSTNNAYAYYMNFTDTDLSTGRASRYRGQSVRLVHSAG